jgi:photosystem II stability/assembly factor-like uncharacterized protein
MYRSTDGAGSWARLGTGFSDVSTQAIVVDPTHPMTIYAATTSTNQEGIFKSADGGATWASVLSSFGGCRALVLHPSTPTTLYAGCYPGVFKTTNGGQNWTEMDSGITSATVTALAVDRSTPTTLYAGTQGDGLFRSTNGGVSWSHVSTGVFDSYVQSIAIDPVTTSTAYVGTLNSGIVRTMDGGATWSAVNSGLTAPQVLSIVVDPTSPQTVYVGTYDGVFQSTDGGTSWFSVGNGLPIPGDNEVYALAIDPLEHNTLYAGTRGGVAKSTDGAASWADVDVGLIATDVRGVVSAGAGTLYAVTYGDGAFRTTDGGTTWSPIDTGLLSPELNALAVDPTNPDTVYAGANESIFKTVDAGATWTGSDVPGLINAIAVDPLSPSTVYAAGYSGALKSTDGGSTWTGINNGLADTFLLDVVVHPSIAGTVYVASGISGVYRSTNGGASWTSVNTGGLANRGIFNLAIDPAVPTRLYAAANDGIYASTDGGTTWSVSLGGVDAFDLLVDASSRIVVASFDGVRISTDAGGDWTHLDSTGLTSEPEVVAVDSSSPNAIFAGTHGGGVFAFQGVCGDGIPDPGEQCDDGPANGTSTSCCAATCAFGPSCAFVPNRDAKQQGSAVNVFPFSCASVAPDGVHPLDGQRYQQVYLGSEVGSRSITQLRLRQTAFGFAFGPTVIPGVTIVLSSTPAAPDALSPTFAANVGGDATVVLDGDLTLSSNPAATIPPPFDIVVPFTTPFQFDASSGRNLLVDVTIPSCVRIGSVDADGDKDDVAVSRVYTNTPGGASHAIADAADSFGLITEFTDCGNGVIEAGEQCDDGAGNGAAGGCCTVMCRFASSGAACDDGDACTGPDQCTATGQCVGTAVDCDDRDACTADSCDSGLGCVHAKLPGAFGAGDGGCLPPDPLTARCEGQVATRMGKLVTTLVKCHTRRATGQLADANGEQACEAIAEAKFVAANAVGCAPCSDAGAAATALEQFVDATNGAVYCTADGTAFGGDDTGAIPADAPGGPVTRCENAIARHTGKLVSAITKCHVARARDQLTTDTAEQLCEDTAKTAFAATSATGCPSCTNLADVATAFEAGIDAANAFAYCAPGGP